MIQMIDDGGEVVRSLSQDELIDRDIAVAEEKKKPVVLETSKTDTGGTELIIEEMPVASAPVRPPVTAKDEPVVPKIVSEEIKKGEVVPVVITKSDGEKVVVAAKTIKVTPAQIGIFVAGIVAARLLTR